MAHVSANTGTDLMDGGNETVIVLRSGSMRTEAGVAGDDTPRWSQRTAVGYRRGAGYEDEPDVVFGDDAVSRSTYRLKFPVASTVSEYGALEEYWKYIVEEELRCNARESSIVVCENVLAPKAERERMLRMVLEGLEFQRAYLVSGSVLAMISVGRESGLVAHCGHRDLVVMPVFELYTLPHASAVLEGVGGDAVTNFLSRLLTEAGYCMTSNAEVLILVRDMKEKVGYVALDFEEELQRAFDDPEGIARNYELPDGQRISIGRPAFECCELLFRPALPRGERTCFGLDALVAESVRKCGAELLNEMIMNVVLEGGASMAVGLAERLQLELERRFNGTNVKVIASPDRREAIWIGGSVLGSMPELLVTRCITREEYEDEGAITVHRRTM